MAYILYVEQVKQYTEHVQHDRQQKWAETLQSSTITEHIWIREVRHHNRYSDVNFHPAYK